MFVGVAPFQWARPPLHPNQSQREVKFLIHIFECQKISIKVKTPKVEINCSTKK